MLSLSWSEWFPPVSWIDAAALVILGLFGLRGYFRGFFREFFSVASLILGLIAAVRYNEPLAAFIKSHWDLSPLLIKGAAFVAAFFVVYFSLNLIGWLLHRSEKLLFLQTLNRVGGVAVGLGKGAALVALALALFGSASWLPHSTRDRLGSGYLAVPLSRLGEGIFRLGREALFPIASEAAQASPHAPRQGGRG